MGLIENNYRLLGQLFRHQVCYFRVKKVMVAVNYNVGMQDLQKQGHDMNTEPMVKTQEHNKYGKCGVWTDNLYIYWLRLSK